MPVKHGERVYYKIADGTVKTGIYENTTGKGRGKVKLAGGKFAMPPKNALHHTRAGATSKPTMGKAQASDPKPKQKMSKMYPVSTTTSPDKQKALLQNVMGIMADVGKDKEAYDKQLVDSLTGKRKSEILDVLSIYEGSIGKRWNHSQEGTTPASWVRLMLKEKVPLEMVKLSKLPLRSLVAGLKKSVDGRGKELKEGAVDFKNKRDVLETIGEEFKKHSGSVSKYFNFPGDKPKKFKANKEQQTAIKTAWQGYWSENFPGQIAGSGDYRNINAKIIHKFFKNEEDLNTTRPVRQGAQGTYTSMSPAEKVFDNIYQGVGFHGLKF